MTEQQQQVLEMFVRAKRQRQRLGLQLPYCFFFFLLLINELIIKKRYSLFSL